MVVVCEVGWLMAVDDGSLPLPCRGGGTRLRELTPASTCILLGSYVGNPLK